MKRAKTISIFGNNTFGEKFDDIVRVGQLAWLPKSTNKYIKTIFQRIEDMTELTTKSAESLQVLNYGIGGHYVPHFDFSTDKSAFSKIGFGNRISTVLFYVKIINSFSTI